jgi:hypothetical protein
MTVNIKLNGQTTSIDKGIAEVVKEFNERGFKTTHSCSSLTEDHPIDAPREVSDIPYISFGGKQPELIEIAEKSGWDWEFSEFGYSSDDKPIDNHSFIGKPNGEVTKYKNRALKKPEVLPDGSKIVWDLESEIPSSKEEAIQSEIECTVLSLDIEDDKSTKQGIANLFKVLIENRVTYKNIR